MKSYLNLAPPRQAVSNDVASCKILYVTECSPWGKIGYENVAKAFRSVQPVFWSPCMPKPDLSRWQGDWIISFKSDLILSRDILKCARKGAINFHPSPPKYRGLGGYWWALHNGDDAFGVTCHHMNERIDHGEIITIENFPILPEETVESLKHRAAIHSLALLNETLDDILSETPLIPCGAKWGRHLYTSQELAQAQGTHAIFKGDSFATQPLIKLLDTRRDFKALEAMQLRCTKNDQRSGMRGSI